MVYDFVVWTGTLCVLDLEARWIDCVMLSICTVEPNVFPHRLKVRSPLYSCTATLSTPHLVSLTRSKKWVLRKKPAGQLLSSTAHQIEREYTILNALHRHNVQPSTLPHQVVPVPQPIVLCEDNDVIGTPFYVMEFLDGRIFTDARMPEVDEETRREW